LFTGFTNPLISIALGVCGAFGKATASATAEVTLPQPSGPQHEIVKQILSYFVRHPRAVDSLAGVARWRLLEEQIYRSVQQTEAALEWLVAKGYLQDVRQAGTDRLYKLNLERRAEAVRFLAAGKSAKGEM
jgi:hypothetical protein